MDPMLMDGMMRLVNFHLGGSLYTMPFAAARLGVLPLALLLGVCGLLTYFVYIRLADVVTVTGQGSLPRLVSKTLGNFVGFVLRVLIVLNALGVVVAYSQAIFDIYEGVTADGAPFEALVVFLTVMALGCLAVPTLEYKYPTTADWGSLLANIALLMLIVVCFWLPPSSKALPDPVSTWTGVVDFGPSLVFAFSSAEYVLRACSVCDDNGEIIQNVDPHKNVKWIGSLSLFVSFMIYFAMAIGGIRCFGADVQDDILKNFSLANSEYPIVNALVLSTNALSLVLSFPVFAETLLLYVRELLHTLLPPQEFQQIAQYINPNNYFLGLIWILPLGTTLAYFATGLLDIINLMSSCTDYAFMFVFPGLVYGLSYPRYTLTWFITASLIVISCVMGYLSFMEAWTHMVKVDGEGMEYTVNHNKEF